jgi:translation initiation factor IF-3
VDVLRPRFCFAKTHKLFRRCINISSKELAINEGIKFKEVRVIGADGSQIGVIPVAQALQEAYAKDLDLVCISPNAQPPVCKIMDYGKYRFEQAKREKEAKKNQKIIETKEIRIIGLGIDTHDFETKAKHAIKFLQSGNKVKVSVRFRGREMGHPEIAQDLMSRFADFCADYCTVEKAAKMEGRNMLMFLAPKSSK